MKKAPSSSCAVEDDDDANNAEKAEVARVARMTAAFLLTRLGLNAEGMRVLVSRAAKLASSKERLRLNLAASEKMRKDELTDEAALRAGGDSSTPTANRLLSLTDASDDGPLEINPSTLVRLIYAEGAGVFEKVIRWMSQEFEDYEVENDDDIAALSSCFGDAHSDYYSLPGRDDDGEFTRAMQRALKAQAEGSTLLLLLPVVKQRSKASALRRATCNREGAAMLPPSPAHQFKKTSKQADLGLLPGASWVGELRALDSKLLMDAVALGELEMVEQYILRSLTPPLKNSTGSNAVPDLHDLLETRHPQLDYGALHAACEFGRVEVAKLLLDYGANPTSRESRNDQTPLHFAAKMAHLGLVNLLLSRGADKTVLDKKFKRAFQLVPDEDCKNDPLGIGAMRESLKDAPLRLDGTRAVDISPSQFKLTWLTPPERDASVATTHYYEVEWRQVHERVVSQAYTRTAAAFNLPDSFLGGPSPTLQGVEKRFYSPKKQLAERRLDVDSTRRLSEDSAMTDSLITGVYPATRHVATVRAFSPGGSGPRSVEVRVTTAATLPSRPGEPFLVQASKYHVVCSWLPPQFENGREIQSYELQRYVVGQRYIVGVSRASRVAAAASASRRKLVEEQPKDRPEGETSADPNDWTTVAEKDWLTFKVAATDRPLLFHIPGLSERDRVVLRVRATNDVPNDDLLPQFTPWSRLSEAFAVKDSMSIPQIASRFVVVEWETYAYLAIEWELQMQWFRVKGRENPWTLVDDQIPHDRTVRYTVRNLRPGSRFRFRVRPRDGYGWREWETCGMTSEEFTTLEDVPDEPLTPEGEEEKCTATEVFVAWSPGLCNGPMITEFELAYLDISKDEIDWTEARVAQIIVASETHCLIQDVHVGESLVFRVRAKNKNGWSEYSPVSKPVLACSRLSPGAPQLIRRGVTFVELGWTPPPVGEVVKYIVHYRPSSCETCWAQLDSGSILHAEARAVVPDMKPAVKYVFRVQALTLDGLTTISPSSAELSALRRF